MKILIVEDDEAQRKLIDHALTRADFEVTSCATMAQAMDYVGHEIFCVAIVDLSLPGESSGLDLIREMVRTHAHTKVIIHTAFASFESAREGIDLGIHAYVEKSLGINHLVNQVNRAASEFLKESLGRAESESRFQIRLLDAVQEGVIATNLKREVIFANRFALELLNSPESSILSAPIEPFFAPLDTAEQTNNSSQFDDFFQSITSTQRWDGEVAIMRGLKNVDGAGSDGDLPAHVPARLIVSPIFDSPGVSIGFIFVFSDITARKHAERQLETQRQLLAHAQRNTTIGQMAGVLAHEINQPLGAITNFVGGLQLGLDSDSVSRTELKHTLDLIQQQAIRASGVIDRLRRFVSREIPKSVIVDVNQLIVDTERLMLADMRSNQVTFKMQLAAGKLMVFGDPIQLQQVLVNLLKNAVDAIAGAESANRQVLVETTQSEKDIHILIVDHGPGITDGELDRVFEPYFSTKKGGMGLGLSISKTIIEHHNGQMSVRQSDPSGLTFELSLPKANPL